MEVQVSLQFSEFQKALTKKNLFTVKILGVAHLLGATVFLGIILFMYSQESPAQIPKQKILPILSIVHICMAPIIYGAVFLLTRLFFSQKSFAKTGKTPLKHLGTNEDTLELRALFVIRTSYILRLAALEGVALFGLITCLVGVQNGEIYDEPIYWLNLFSYVVFTATTLWTFPTKDRLEIIFRRHFLGYEQFSIPE